MNAKKRGVEIYLSGFEEWDVSRSESRPSSTDVQTNSFQMCLRSSALNTPGLIISRRERGSLFQL